jgi:hypothetical protein
MAYTIPTAAEFKAAFPAFAAVPDAAIDQAISESTAYEDETWPDQQTYANGLMLLAAHFLTQQGLGTGAEAAAAAGGMSNFQRAKSGTFEFDRGAKAASAGSDPFYDDLMSTAYGRRWAALAKRLFSGPLVLGGGCSTPSSRWARLCLAPTSWTARCTGRRSTPTACR